MLRKINPEISLGFFVASLFWLCVVGWQASYVPTEKQKDECYETAKKTGYKTDECKTFWERTTSDPIALFNLILAVSTVGLWGATISLYRAGNNQLELARQEFIATHRPLVIVRFVQGPFYDDDGREYAYLTVANIGETTATITSIGHDLARGNEDGEWIAPGVGAGLGSIDPVALESGDRHVITVSARLPINETMIFGDATGTYERCIVGRVRYRDGNGRVRETGFLRAYDETREHFVILPADAEENYQD